MSSEVNLTKEVNMENVDRDQGLIMVDIFGFPWALRQI
jgi:hypothetical protein